MLNEDMRINDDQLNSLLAELRDLKAGQTAIKAQLAELHGRMNKILDQIDDTNARISFQRRPKP